MAMTSPVPAVPLNVSQALSDVSVSVAALEPVALQPVAGSDGSVGVPVGVSANDAVLSSPRAAVVLPMTPASTLFASAVRMPATATAPNADAATAVVALKATQRRLKIDESKRTPE